MERQPSPIARLVADLQSPDEFVRAQSAFALGMLGEPAVEPLLHLLDHAEHNVRMRAAWALGVIGQPALSALLALAEGPNRQLRAEAIRVLGVIGEARVLNHLIHALTDLDSQVAQRSAIALGKIGDLRAFHPLLTALRHPTADVRYAACGALADLQAAEALPSLEELAQEDPHVTSWGASVAGAARRAMQEIAAARPSSTLADYVRLREMLQRQDTDLT